ncbi:serine dehydratase alpha chain-domain-containing protein [Globomyces pollinis-pini]|nr:serine dehydratase alpha chain-domain-containing protein [Globomyces pollinis-pini]
MLEDYVQGVYGLSNRYDYSTVLQFGGLQNQIPFIMNLVKRISSTIRKKLTSRHAVVSTFDLFSIGIGPSSSHTVGPMRAAKIFVEDLLGLKVLNKVHSVRADLYGSLALTGVGHGTPNAVLMGLSGETPELIDAKSILPRVDKIYKDSTLSLNGTHTINFIPKKHLIFHFKESLPQHPNGMRFSCYDAEGELIATNEFFSIGGGFVVNDQTNLAANVYFRDSRVDHVENLEKTSEVEKEAEVLLSTKNLQTSDPDQNTQMVSKIESKSVQCTLPFYDSASLMQICEKKNMTIAQVVFENELQWRDAEEVVARTIHLWDVMNESIQNGISSEQDFLPGGLRVQRRAPKLHAKLMRSFANYAPTKARMTSKSSLITEGAVLRPQRSLPALDWINLYALAVNEENAAGGRVVTAPTNGAAGTIPAVLKYYLDFICPTPGQKNHDIIEFLLTASAIGMLYKRGASISAAEMGCQGEVGVACSMAAGAFAAVMGGTIHQIENAAEIAMEHNLGLTCDPPMGLVIIPCIERNALAAVKAVTAAQLALNGDGTHRVSLDQVIATMRQTGIDMQSKYKETSEGGLAVNVPVC